MSVYSNHDAPEQARIPPGHVIVPRFSFVPSFLHALPRHLRIEDDAGVAIGLRLIADSDLQTARVQAAKKAIETHPKAGDSPLEREHLNQTYLAHVIRHVVAYGTCDPNDVDAPCPYWAADPVEELRYALTDGGMGLVFDAWERLRIELDPLNPLLADEEMPRLVELLEGGSLGRVHPEGAIRVRKLLSFVLDELERAERGS